MNKKIRPILLAVLVPLIAVIASCGGGNDGFGGNDNCDYIIAAGFSGTGQLVTDSFCPKSIDEDWEVHIDFRAPTSGAGDLPAANERSQFDLAYYDVTYRNLRTGGTVVGVDVPAPFRQSVQSIADPGGLITLTNFPILQAGQKQNAPLNDSSFYSAGGVPMTATLTWWGWPITNPSAKCFYVMEWNFTIFQGLTPPPVTSPDYLTYVNTCD